MSQSAGLRAPGAVAAMLLGGCAGEPRTAEGESFPAGPEYHVLMAEVAMERKDYRGAAQEYLTAAEQSTDERIARRATEFAFAVGLDAFALRSALRWAQLEPYEPVAHEVLARLNLRRYRLDAALDAAERALGPSEPRRDQDYLALASDLGEEENAVYVTRLLARLAAQDPLAPGLQLALGTAALRSGDTTLALGAASAALADDPEWPEARVLRARALLAAGATDSALEDIDSLAREQPGLGVGLERARLTSAAGQVPAAAAQLDDLEQEYGAQPEITRMRAFVALAGDDLDGAWDAFNRLLKDGYSVYENLYFLGQIAAEREGPEAAIRLYRRVKAGDYLVPARLAMAAAYGDLDDADTALAELEQFAEEQPRQAFEIAAFRAEFLQALGRHEEALEAFDAALVYRPESPILLMGRGTVLDSLGRSGAAIRELQRAARIAPDNAAVLNALGYTLANRTRRIKEADPLVRLAFELAPGSPAIMDSMGWVRYRQGRLEEARSYLEEAYGVFPDPEVAAHLGEVLWKLDEREQAREIWTAALTEHPENVPLNETLERVLK